MIRLEINLWAKLSVNIYVFWMKTPTGFTNSRWQADKCICKSPLSSSKRHVSVADTAYHYVFFSSQTGCQPPSDRRQPLSASTASHLLTRSLGDVTAEQAGRRLKNTANMLCTQGSRASAASGLNVSLMPSNDLTCLLPRSNKAACRLIRWNKNYVCVITGKKDSQQLLTEPTLHAGIFCSPLLLLSGSISTLCLVSPVYFHICQAAVETGSRCSLESPILEPSHMW